jgi:glycosyltransferase involved in cell wall biosynthesis
MHTPKVAILLSTYNGEAFLEELLDSLLGQDYKNYEIFIRDDGSVDKTVRILKNYEKHNHVHCVYSENIGVVRSFYTLLSDCPINADYYAFCDQDDIWAPCKISDAVDCLKGDNEEVKLYFSALNYVDINGNYIGCSAPVNTKPTFNNAILQNLAVGCTTVINKSAREKILRNVNFSEVYMFDWWVFLVCTFFGKVYFSEKSYIGYRQHSNNAVGASAANNFRKCIQWLVYLNKRPKRFVKRQLLEFHRVYCCDYQNINHKLLSEIIELDDRNIIFKIYKFSKIKIFRQVGWQTYCAKLLFILGLI